MLPKLIYVADVPVEATFHGSAVLYRLLEKYPAGHLTIVETGSTSTANRRLPNVKYLASPLGRTRLMDTRFHPYMVALFSALAKNARTLLSTLKNVDIESVLTVAHGFGWLAAAELAKSRDVPLHLIVHDDWPRAADVPQRFRNWLDRRFAEVYAQAQSRLCISPTMRDTYYERYGPQADVLYPLRNERCPDFDYPPLRLGQNGEKFTVAFAGSINTRGYVEALKTLRTALETVDGRLMIFGPLTAPAAREVGLDQSNVLLGGLLKWEKLIEKLRHEAHALFVPMSFTTADSWNMQMAFPSKLADYTAVGLPLLIYGPQYCSAVRWARENPGVAEVVTDAHVDALTEAIRRLASAPADRVRLGMRALETGRQYFSYETIQSVFNRALMATRARSEPASESVYCSAN